jgi:ribosome assembly protein YihI (activator of Der GTPase)
MTPDIGTITGHVKNSRNNENTKKTYVHAQSENPRIGKTVKVELIITTPFISPAYSIP